MFPIGKDSPSNCRVRDEEPKKHVMKLVMVRTIAYKYYDVIPYIMILFDILYNYNTWNKPVTV